MESMSFKDSFIHVFVEKHAWKRKKGFIAQWAESLNIDKSFFNHTMIRLAKILCGSQVVIDKNEYLSFLVNLLN